MKTPLLYLADRSDFKSDFSTRSEPVSSPSSSGFTTIEQKVLRLALDPAAHKGEADACGIKLVRLLRRRRATAEQIIASYAQSTWTARELMAARGYVVQGGKFHGKTVGELPAWYLRWALKNRRDMSFNLKRAMQLIYNEGQAR